jgi:6-pyruvoyltetrahydropterin/6-carboxytetrahydropterin synthase
MKIAKEFRWEMGHRLPSHSGLCKNVHGHSYRMIVEITGDVRDDGMVIDFFDLNKVVEPIIEKYDHAFLCSRDDKIMADFLSRENMKRVFVEYPSTVENICRDLSFQIGKAMENSGNGNIASINVRLFETPNSYAESTVNP